MKKVLRILIAVTILVSLFSSTAYASNETHTHCNEEKANGDVKVVYISSNDFEHLIANTSNIISPMGITCCDRAPRLEWRTTSIMHIYPNPAGYCQSVAYFGDQYCTYCGAVWQYGVCYRQTSGCGSYHGGIIT
ncbi:MAG TPA: hypothetical protein GXX75_17495 [Clostridiales bacterium]|nr:hypothetical protein [Clostridiales bacterium]